MGLNEKLSVWPSPQGLKRGMLVGLVVSVVDYIVLGYFFILSGWDVNNTLLSQLCFSGPVLKSLYVAINNPTSLMYYKIGQGLDYVFMFGYGTLIFSIGVYLGRNFPSASKWQRICFLMAIFGVVAALFDAMENMFIFLTLSDPLGFPDWYAVGQSSVSVMKWFLLLASIVILLVGLFYNRISKRGQKT
ncbi:MAG TPA: hypothetical protein VKK79_20235 [Candidatus Lokiarchaeia archaeon]|nr:hypothetical protein [Candidatus Lokiarchaeia archaeon]